MKSAVRARWCFSVLGALAVGAWAPGAQAYVCTQVPGDGPTLWWEPRLIPITFHERCSGDVPDTAACAEALRDSMRAWNAVGCSDFAFGETPPTADLSTGFDWRNPDAAQNVIIFREGDSGDPRDTWRHQRGALAITTVTFNSDTGRILDADIEFNGVAVGASEFVFAVCPESVGGCTGRNDIQNTMTHELGHVLGLDHPPVPEATMYASAPPGELSKRTLFSDDENGLCAVYPDGLPTTPCVAPPDNPPPAPTFREIDSCDDTGLDPCDRPGCSQAGGVPGWAVACAGWVLLSRRRARRHGPGG